jgi:hypothetical protein
MDVKRVEMVEAMGASSRSAAMMGVTSARSVVMVETMAGQITKIEAGPMVVLMAQDVVDSKVVVVVAAPPLLFKTSHVRFAKNMDTLLVNVGGATLIEMMMMILTLKKRVPMGLTQIGMWIVVLLIISLVS